ncbi:MAG: hypothetical protein ACKVQK_00500, partial [Burkholderiales bacterium]
MNLDGLHVAWFADFGTSFVSENLLLCVNSDLTGLRLRMGMPAQALATRGVCNTLVSIAPGDKLPMLDPKPDIAVFTKAYIYTDALRNESAERFIEAAQSLKQSGTAIVFDLSDNLFADPRREYALQMLRLADEIVTSSSILGELVIDHCGKTSHVAPEPLEGLRREPRFVAQPRGFLKRLFGGYESEPLRLLWFGAQPGNFRALMRWRAELARLARHRALQLEIVMKPVEEIRQGVAAMQNDGIAATLHTWSPATMTAQLEQCDLVLLPTDSTDQHFFTASPNRLVTAMWAGRFVIAGAIPSYLEFNDCAGVGDNPVAGI